MIEAKTMIRARPVMREMAVPLATKRFDRTSPLIDESS